MSVITRQSLYVSLAYLACAWLPAYAEPPQPGMPPPVKTLLAPAPAAKQDHGDTAGSFLSGHFASASGDQEAAAGYLEDVLKREPGNVEVASQLLIIRLMSGEVPRALELAEKLKDADNHELIVDLLFSVEQARIGRFQNASARLTRVEASAGDTLWLPLIEAWLNAGQGLLQQPVEAIDFVTDTSKIPPFLYYHLALINDFAGFPEVAQRQYELSIADLARTPFRAVEALADFYRRQSQPEKRRALLDNYALERPDAYALLSEADAKNGKRTVGNVQQGLAEIFFTMGSVLLSADQGYDTLLYLQMSVYLRQDFPAAWLMLGNTLEASGNYARAARAYSMVGENTPFYQRALLRRAFILDKQGDPQQAMRMLDSLIAKNPGALTPYIAKGDLLRAKSQFKEAEAAYSDAIAQLKEPDASQWALYFARGACRERIGNAKGAESDFAKALELQPDQPEVLNYLGYMWLVRGERVEEAAHMIAKAYEQRSDQPHIIDSMGWLYYKTGKLPQAAGLLEKAVTLMPNDPSVNDHLGDVYWQSGRRTEARFQWQKALGLTKDRQMIETLQNKIAKGLPAYTYSNVKVDLSMEGDAAKTAPSLP